MPGEHVANRIMKVAISTVQLLVAGATYHHTVRTVTSGRTPPEFGDVEYPSVHLISGMHTYEDTPNPLYTRHLPILGEARLKIEDRSLDAEREILRFLADLETAFGANMQIEETVGNPATKLAVEWRFVNALPLVDFPSFPFCTLVFSLDAHYRTLRSSPSTPR